MMSPLLAISEDAPSHDQRSAPLPQRGASQNAQSDLGANAAEVALGDSDAGNHVAIVSYCKIWMDQAIELARSPVTGCSATAATAIVSPIRDEITPGGSCTVIAARPS